MYTKLEQNIFNDVFDWNDLVNPDIKLDVTSYVIRELYKNLSKKVDNLNHEVEADVARIKLYMDYFTHTLLSTPEDSYDFYSDNRILANALVSRALVHKNVWLDTHMHKDTFISIIGTAEHYAYVNKSPESIKKLWLDKICQICTAPYVFDADSPHMASNCASMILKTFETEIFSRWPSYTYEQKAYLWCYKLESIERDIIQSDILSFLGKTENRTASDEHREVMSKYLDSAEFNLFNTITSLYDKSATELYTILKDVRYSQDLVSNTPIDFEIA